MKKKFKSGINLFLYKFFPLILLYTSVLNESDFNYISLKYFSFNFSYILIFYYSLKRSQSLGYMHVFIAVFIIFFIFKVI